MCATVRKNDHSHHQQRMTSLQFRLGKKSNLPKKMYSNFVGVTYNKTHAKYQSCITHYRKQHYLGRYKLACDAALAYDESAKLLKGKAWKVNFPTRQAYEQEREKEIHHIGRIGGNTADIDESETASIEAGKIAKSKVGWNRCIHGIRCRGCRAW